MTHRSLVIALAAIVGAVSACAGPAKPVARETDNAVSMGPAAANSYRSFAPELPQTVARMPQIDPATGVHVREVKPNLFYVTDGIYQAAFVRTGQGIIVFDAPPSFAQKLPALIAEHGGGETVKYLVYSHGHADHVGGSKAFEGVAGLKVVAPATVAAGIQREAHPGILVPNVTFADAYSFSLGREVVEIEAAYFHSEHADAIIYLPRQKFIVAVDTIKPGDVPYANFGSTSRFAGYVDVFDRLLRYDFDTILSGHTSILGSRDDVAINRDYVNDVRATALRGMDGMLATFQQAFAAMDHKNGNLAYRVAIESVRRDCTKQIIDRWKDRLSVVDVWGHTHCESVIQYAIMH